MRSTHDTPFIPPDIDPSDFASIQPAAEALLRRPVDTPQALRRWLCDASKLFEVLHDEGARRNIRYACNTADAEAERAYREWHSELQPKTSALFFRIQKHVLESPAAAHVGEDTESALLLRKWSADVQCFSEQNLPLEAELGRLKSAYDKRCGAMQVDFDGTPYTLQQMAAFLEGTDRHRRERAWRLSEGRRLEDRDAIDDIFQQMLDLRQQLAVNAGFDDFRAYTWQRQHRFDYTPSDCHAFADAVHTVCLPLVRQVHADRAAGLGLPSLRPWDTSVDPQQRPPLKPFDPQDTDGLVARTRAIFDRLDPTLAQQFQQLADKGHLELASRPNKRGGGFQTVFQASNEPFIFMNAAGLQRDVETLVHEAGHAFHSLASSDVENVFLRYPTPEFGEVAAMAMELIAADHYDLFYEDPEHARRARQTQLENLVHRLLWIAVIDSFQHWLYTHPGHSADQRSEAWLATLDRFDSGWIDWTGLEAQRAVGWQRQIHLFHVPFYYIEYGIAQIGALQAWLNYRREPSATLSTLRSAFALGGTRPLPELFNAAGLDFDFSESALQPLVQALRHEVTMDEPCA